MTLYLRCGHVVSRCYYFGNQLWTSLLSSKSWCKDVAVRAKAWVTEELGNIVAKLILMDPELRLSASAASRRAIDLGPPSSFSHASQPYGQPLQSSQAFSLDGGYSTGDSSRHKAFPITDPWELYAHFLLSCNTCQKCICNN